MDQFNFDFDNDDDQDLLPPTAFVRAPQRHSTESNQRVQQQHAQQQQQEQQEQQQQQQQQPRAPSASSGNAASQEYPAHRLPSAVVGSVGAVKSGTSKSAARKVAKTTYRPSLIEDAHADYAQMMDRNDHGVQYQRIKKCEIPRPLFKNHIKEGTTHPLVHKEMCAKCYEFWHKEDHAAWACDHETGDYFYCILCGEAAPPECDLQLYLCDGERCKRGFHLKCTRAVFGANEAAIMGVEGAEYKCPFCVWQDSPAARNPALRDDWQQRHPLVQKQAYYVDPLTNMQANPPRATATFEHLAAINSVHNANAIVGAPRVTATKDRPAPTRVRSMALRDTKQATDTDSVQSARAQDATGEEAAVVQKPTKATTTKQMKKKDAERAAMDWHQKKEVEHAAEHRRKRGPEAAASCEERHTKVPRLESASSATETMNSGGGASSIAPTASAVAVKVENPGIHLVTMWDSCCTTLTTLTDRLDVPVKSYYRWDDEDPISEAIFRDKVKLAGIAANGMVNASALASTVGSDVLSNSNLLVASVRLVPPGVTDHSEDERYFDDSRTEKIGRTAVTIEGEGLERLSEAVKVIERSRAKAGLFFYILEVTDNLAESARTLVSQRLGVAQYRKLNASEVSDVYRPRLYWTNIADSEGAKPLYLSWVQKLMPLAMESEFTPREDRLDPKGEPAVKVRILRRPAIAHAFEDSGFRTQNHLPILYSRKTPQSRTLTVTECERLMGFAPDHTLCRRASGAGDLTTSERQDAVGRAINLPALLFFLDKARDLLCEGV